VLPYNRLIIDAVQGLGVPVIHFSTGTSGYLEAVDEAGAAVVAVDWRVSLGAAWQRLAYAPGIQGNLDPVRLLAPQAELKSAVLDILMQAGGRPGHIFNLGHGILPDTPVENVRAVVEWVHEFQLPEAPA
jgi:uroporphyrinogen decarboxylase